MHSTRSAEFVRRICRFSFRVVTSARSFAVSIRSVSATRIPKVWMAAGVAAAFLGLSAPSAAQTFSVVHPFTDPGGTNPNAALVQASDGNFYGTNLQGGASDAGTLFRVT